MPFVQRENISHFVRACQMPPLSLPDHDIFLTDDLYESKDPAQVLQCIVAFSRRANAVNPLAIPRAIGAKSKSSLISPQLSGTGQSGYGRPPIGLPHRERGSSNASDSSATAWNPLAKGSYAGRASPTKASGLMSPPGNTSSWSKKGDEGNTSPAWNIHQYGYMGGASQGNQGISFGARRQITSMNPTVPSLAEKERRRKEEEKEVERQRMQAEEAERKRRLDLEAEEERNKYDEEERWQEETRRLRQKEIAEAEAEKRRWDEEQRRWKEEEENRLREEREIEARKMRERDRQRGNSDARLRGQFLSQYQAEQNSRNPQNGSGEASRSTSESQRIMDLERQLELAKERERQYQVERQERLKNNQVPGRHPPEEQIRGPLPEAAQPQVPPKNSHEDDWQDSERDYLQKEWQTHNNTEIHQQPPSLPRAPKPTHAEPIPPALFNVESDNYGPLPPPRPLPDPKTYAPDLNRTDRYLSLNPAPAPVQPQSHRPADYSTINEVDLENQRRKESQVKTKAGGWASKSLLEKEMERERERQREWEESQKQTVKVLRDKQEGVGPGQSWDVHQYGYMGGDSQNRGGAGLGVGGARRQIIGPRPPP
jgi:transgelin